MKCEECEKEFKNRNGLHRHIPSHCLSVEAYYHKHEPRFDILYNELINFKSYDQYSTSKFNSNKDIMTWLLLRASREEIESYLAEIMQDKYSQLPGEAVWNTYHVSLARLAHHEKFSMGDYHNLGRKLGIDSSFNQFIYDFPYKDIKIRVDTREQRPLIAKNSDYFHSAEKLDYGDYECGGLYVERKSVNDLCSTLVRNLDRFERELQRAQHDHLVVLVEGSVEDVRGYQFTNYVVGHKALHEVRRLSREYPVQFLFANDRAEARDWLIRILSNPNKSRVTDLQFARNLKQCGTTDFLLHTRNY